jgi:hypothetical protein
VAWGYALRTFRPIDRSLASHGDAEDAQPRRRDDKRPSVEDKFAYYWSGQGWHLALTEARKLLVNGVAHDEVATNVGWSVNELRIAVRRGRPPKANPEPPDPVSRERPKRTVMQRVEGLKDVDDKTMARARRLYEIEIMTVREVARTIEQPYEKTYLILKKAGTKFRRPGRRAAD